MKYHIWTEGCQMNVADSQRVGSSLEHLGYTFTETIEEADVIVLNTCVVRQSAEDKAMGRLTSLSPLKKKNPNLVINLMGCMVGVRGAEKLREKLPYVDVFSPPSDPGPLISHLTQGEIHSIEDSETTRRFLMMDDELILPVASRASSSAHMCRLSTVVHMPARSVSSLPSAAANAPVSLAILWRKSAHWRGRA